MSIEYCESKSFTPDELRELFLSVGWSSGKYPERLRQAMMNSDSVISAWQGEQLVGLINCLSDGALTAYIHYLLVRPECQGTGIGRTLLKMMMEKYSHCMRKVLIADAEQVGFYEKCGFVAGTGTMALFRDDDSDFTQDVL